MARTRGWPGGKGGSGGRAHPNPVYPPGLSKETEDVDAQGGHLLDLEARAGGALWVRAAQSSHWSHGVAGLQDSSGQSQDPASPVGPKCSYTEF